MAISLTVNGASYAYPEFRDTNWANPATNWASAVTTVLGYFQSGTGPTSGLQAPFLTSTTANAASAGMLRLAVANVISWRNNANSANLDLAVNGSNALTFNGSALGYGSVTSVAATAPAAGFTIAGSPITTSGTLVFTLSDDLAALEALASTGLAARTAASTWATRTITGTADKIDVADGNGVSANPTITISATYAGQTSIVTLGTVTTGTWNGTDVAVTAGGTGASDASTARTNLGLAIGTNVQAWDADLDAIAALGSTGIAVRSAANTWVQRVIAATANQISVADGGGVAANPTISLADNLAMPGTTGFTPVTGTTAQRGSTEAVTRYNSTLAQLENNALVGSSAVVAQSGIRKAGTNRHRFYENDDFTHGPGAAVTLVAGTSALGSVGDHAWTLTASTNNGSYVLLTSSTDHPGTIQLTTGATSGDAAFMSNGMTVLVGAQALRFSAIVRIPTITDVTVVIGYGQVTSSDTFGTHGAFFSFDPAGNASWIANTRTASNTTPTDTAVDVIATDWYLLEIVRVSSGSYKFYINGAEVADHSTNLPEADNCQVGQFRVKTNTGTARTLDIDYWEFQSVELGQRWT